MEAQLLQAPKQAPLFTNRTLLKLILPLVVEQLLLMTVGMADTLMVTSTGQAAVAGVSLVDSINLLIIQVFSALATGGAVVAAQYLGRREVDNARTAAKQLLYAITAVSVLLMLVALVFRQHLLYAIFGYIEADVMDSALIYFLLTAASYPFIAIYNSGAALFRAMGNSKVSMFNSVLMNVINIGVNALLIYGFGMGAAGAGWGTLISRAMAAIIVLVLICQPKHVIFIDRLFHPQFNWAMVKNILRIGIPNGVENGMFQVGKLMVQGIISHMGTAAIAANAIANSIAGVVNVPGNAVSLSLITVVGQCMGAGEPKQAVAYTKKMVGGVYLTMGVLSIVLFFTAAPLCSLFNLVPSAARMAAEVLRWCAVFSLIFWPLAFSLPNALRAAGDAKFTMIVSMISMWSCRIGFSYLLVYAFDMGLLGVWVAMFIDWVLRALVFLFRFWRGRWKTKQVLVS